MTGFPDDDRPPALDVGDRVVALVGLGGFWRRRVRPGLGGIIIARAGRDRLTVRFTSGRVLTARPTELAPASPEEAM